MKSAILSVSAGFVLFLSSLLILVELYYHIFSFPLVSYNFALILLSSATVFLQIYPTSSLLRLNTLKYVFLLEAYFGLVLLSVAPDIKTSFPAKLVSGSLVLQALLLFCLITLQTGSVYQTVQTSRNYVKFEDEPKLTSVASFTSFHSVESPPDDSFFSPLLTSCSSDPFLSHKASPAVLRLSDLEKKVISELKQKCAFISDLDLLKLGWSRGLDVTQALEVYKMFNTYISDFKIKEISMNKVRDNFAAGFSVLAGKDLQGRTMLWQRMCFMTPATIPLEVGIKSTWLALDAGLSDEVSNRLGVALVYDFTNIGFSNITLNVLDIKHGALACGAAHPSHISRVVFINAPSIFRLAYVAVKPLLPTAVVEVVEFISTGDGAWFSKLCTQDQLPRYLKCPRLDGEFERASQEDTNEYLSWLFEQLKVHHLIYDQ